MANENGYQKSYKVYRIVQNGKVQDFQTFYGYVYINSFDSNEDAEDWIINEGERNIDYTVVQVIRNR